MLQCLCCVCRAGFAGCYSVCVVFVGRGSRVAPDGERAHGVPVRRRQNTARGLPSWTTTGKYVNSEHFKT